jgi:hypothetical protein
MEVRVGLEGGPVGAQGVTAGAHHALEVGEIGQHLVGDGLVDERPEPFGGLQLRRVGWEQDEIDAVRESQLGGAMPAGLVAHQHHPVIGIDAFIAGELGEREGKRLGAHGREQAPPTLPGRRPHEAVDVESLKAPSHAGRGPGADRRPDAAGDGQESEPMLILRPEGHRGGGMGALDAVELAL